ncbi:histone-lysine N-methyltransferase ASHR2 [Malania oleifera]|uniref:histone-lysine N-methyltransferase ASHR2 n=1 Tax=Malania oleifera TaxID=397392 RepID=UPI0025ADDEBB|nr:histone-lysine N-methyltransferase ASHR2 [Malania oleifera]XP_057978003.1 histone-lysine N-methyltransferase ASHR2 [Malania oleifera]
MAAVECQFAAATGATAPSVTVAEIHGRGRALVSSQPLKAGQIVFRDSPILLYSAFPFECDGASSSSIAADRNYCSHCFRKLHIAAGASIISCPSCSHTSFCSPSCRSAALSSTHTPWVCRTLIRLRNCPSLVALDQDRQVQARFLVAAYNLAAVSPSDFQILLSLQGAGDGNDAAVFLHSLISSLSPPPQSVSVELTAALLAKDKLNAFGLMEPFSPGGERSVRAYGMYPNASFFNHDCLPNACRFDYVDTDPDGNTDIIVRMIHDVPRGREICLSYFPVNEKYSHRQRRLLEDYGFTCECDRCKVEANWSDEEEEEEEGDEMDEDSDDRMGMGVDDVENALEAESDFPHAYFFLRYMCNRDNCWGTLAPLPPSNDGTPSNVVECNVCGSLKKDEDEGDANSMDD